MVEKGEILKIAWDGDGVAINSYQPVLAVVNQELSQYLKRNIQLTKANLTGWDAISKIVINLTGDQQLATRLEANWFNPEVLRNSPPNSAVIKVINRCQEELPYVDQFLITTRNHQCAGVTREWLDEQIPLIDWSNRLYIRQPGDTRTGDQFKVDSLIELKIDHMSEDNTGTVINIVAKVPQCRLSYFTQPWNESDNDPIRSALRVPHDDPDILFQRIIATRTQFLESL